MVRLVNPAAGILAPGVTAQKIRQLTLNEIMGMGGPLEILVNNTKWDGKQGDGSVRTDFTPVTVDGVTEAAAVGAPSRKRGHDIELFICGDATSAAVLDRCSRALPKHAVPVRVTRVDSLPTSPSGKIRKRDLL